MEILLKNALMPNASQPYSFSRADILINGNKITKISSSISSSSDEKIDCSDKLILPGFINAHTHASMSLLRGVGDDLHLQDWLNTVWKREEKIDANAIKAGAMLACAEMIRGGTTCFNDMYFHMDSIAKSVEESGIRALLGYGMIDRIKYGDKAEYDFEGKGKKELKIGEEFAKKWDGKAGGRITCSIAPHAPNTCSKELLITSSELAKKLNCKLHIHLAETRAELAESIKIHKKRPAEFLDECKVLGKNTIAAHGVYCTKSEVKLLAYSKTSIAHCPVSNLKLAGGGAAPIPEYLEAGANLALGTDGAASNNSLNMFESMKVGAIEQKNFRFDAGAIKADDYLKMATEGGAQAIGINAGKIKEGCLADLILLDLKSPNLIPFQNNAGWLVYSAGIQNITDTMADGKWLMRNKELVTMDEQRVLKEAQRAADKLA